MLLVYLERRLWGEDEDFGFPRVIAEPWQAALCQGTTEKASPEPPR